MKVLIISNNCFSIKSNNGKTLAAIFSSFNKDDLAQLYFYPQYPDSDCCSNYFRITDVDIIKYIMRKASSCGSMILCSKGDGEDKISIADKRKYNFFSKKAKNLRIFRDFLWKTNVWETKELIKWCKDFNPDVIFFVAGNGSFAHSIALRISQFLKKPLVIYFTDDYLLYVKPTFIQLLQHFRVKKFFQRSIDYSSMRFAIGELMANEYGKYFNKHFEYIMNAVDIVPFVASPTYQSPIIISYFGGLHLNRWKMLVRLANILKEYVHLRVYTASELTDEIQQSFAIAQIEYCGCVVGDELCNARLKSDVLLHVESDDVTNRAYTRLAISTKIPEYLISGRIVLGFGPEEVASMKILKDNNIGVVISSDLSDDAIKKAFLDNFSDNGKCESMRKRAYEYAREHFDKKSISSNFRLLLESVVHNS